MTLSSTANRIKYNGDGSTTQFAFPYYYLATSDLKVVLINASGVETLLTETTHYSVSAPSPSGGTVTMVTAPAATEKLVIYREVPMTQGFDPEEGGPLPADEAEKALDKLTMQVQQLYEILGRSIKLNVGSAYSALILPDPEASKYLQWKTDLSGLQNVSQIDTDSVSVSSFMETVLDEANINAFFGVMDQPFWIVDPDLADQNAAGSTGSIAWILAQLSGSEGYIILPAGGTFTLTDDLTLPSTVTIKVMSGAQFSIPSAKTLTINGTIEAGEYQIFTGAGEIDFVDGIRVKASWFADFETAIDKIDSDKVELLIDQAESISNDVTVPSNITLRFTVTGNLLTVASGKTLTIQGPIKAHDIQVFAGDGELDFSDGKRVKLSWFANLETAIDRIDTDKVELLIDTPATVSNDKTVDANTSLRWTSAGNLITVAAAKTLTVNGLVLADPLIPIFTVTGALTLDPRVKTSARWFTGSDIGDQINKAIKAHTVNAGHIFLPPVTTAESFSTTILFNKLKTIDFMNSRMIYTGTGNAIVTGKEDLSGPNTASVGDAALYCKLKNLYLEASGVCDHIVKFLGNRTMYCENFYIKKTTQAASSDKACIALKGGDAAPTGPGGCHYNHFSKIKLDGGTYYIDDGFLIDTDGTQECNANTIEHIEVQSTLYRGIKIIAGYGITIIHPVIEGIGSADNTAGTGMKIAVNSVTLIDPYMENLLYGINMLSATDLCIVGGLKSSSVANAYQNKDAGELYVLGEDWA